jgi:poly(3-hydroxybutyrate) depolymerase
VDLEVELRSYTGCDGNGEVDFYVIAGAGHRWPGDTSPLPPEFDVATRPACLTNEYPCLGVTTLDIDATAVAWEFFQNHPMA